MDLYIGPLAPEADLHQLAEFCGRHARGARLELREQPVPGRPPRRFGILHLSSERRARKAQRALDGRELAGRPVTVREFVHRAYANDRRTLHWRRKVWQEVERRQGERRAAAVRPASDDALGEGPATPPG